MSKYGVFFWSVFSRIWTKYEDLLRNSLYSVQIRKNTDQKKPRIWTLFNTLCLFFWRFQRVLKWNIDLKRVKDILQITISLPI